VSSIAVLLPLSTDSVDGFTMIKDFVTQTKQNLKMLMLTTPGERVMVPDYGVGLKQFFFSNFNQTSYAAIQDRIRTQVGKWMPGIQILNIEFPYADPDHNYLGVVLTYSIPGVGITERLALDI